MEQRGNFVLCCVKIIIYYKQAYATIIHLVNTGVFALVMGNSICGKQRHGDPTMGDNNVAPSSKSIHPSRSHNSVLSLFLHVITETRHVFLKTRTETKNETKKKREKEGQNVAVLLQRGTVAGPQCGALSSLVSLPSIKPAASTPYCTAFTHLFCGGSRFESQVRKQLSSPKRFVFLSH